MKRIINSENYKIERHSSLSPSSASSRSDSASNTNKYRVSRSREKIKLTQKYRILNAYDPHTGHVFSLSQIVALKLINKYTSSFQLPSTGQLIALDDAIQLGYVRAELIDEYLETSNESYEFIHDDSSTKEDNLNKASLSATNSILKVDLTKKIIKKPQNVYLFIYLKFLTFY